MQDPNSWATFNGDLKAQKYSPADQITPENVDQLEKVWEYHTGDVSDGSGDIPTTVWSATPLFVNDTLYIGTPFYRIIALEPGTGKEKWSFDPHARLEALTQPAMKNRGVAYWQADEIQEGEACQKMVYIGTMDAKLYGVDADTGKPRASFGKDGMLDVNQWNTVNDKWPLSLLQAATVYQDTLFLGWAGKDWTNSAAPPGTVFALDAKTGKQCQCRDAIGSASASEGHVIGHGDMVDGAGVDLFPADRAHLWRLLNRRQPDHSTSAVAQASAFIPCASERLESPCLSRSRDSPFRIRPTRPTP